VTNRAGIFATTAGRSFDTAVAPTVDWRGALSDHRTVGAWDLFVTGAATLGAVRNTVVAVHGDPELEGSVLTADALAERFSTDGYQLFARLVGSFALLLLDSKTDTAIAVRDFMGTKPLVWGQGDDGTAVASEPLAIPLLLGVKPRPAERTIELYLDRVNPRVERTMIAGAIAVPPNSTITLCPEHAVNARTPVKVTPLDIDEDEALATTRTILDNAIRRSVGSGERVIAAASGGVGSSVLACSGLEQGIVEAIITHQTLGLTQWNEVPRATLIAERFGVPHHVEKIDPPDALHRVSDEILIHGPSNPTSWPSLATTKPAASLGFDTLVAGHLSDEWLNMAGGPIAHAVIERDWGHLRAFLGEEVASGHLYRRDVPGYVGRLIAGSLRRRMSYPDVVLRRFQWDGIVQRTMNSLEREACASDISLALPFADRDYVVHVLGLPLWFRNRPGEPKWILRQAYSDVLPAAYVNAPIKADFRDLPVLALFKDEYDPDAADEAWATFRSTWADKWREALEEL